MMGVLADGSWSAELGLSKTRLAGTRVAMGLGVLCGLVLLACQKGDNGRVGTTSSTEAASGNGGGGTGGNASGGMGAGPSAASMASPEALAEALAARELETKCKAENCACQKAADCPASYWVCLPNGCGGPQYCRYGASSAAAHAQRYVCRCDGTLDRRNYPGVPDSYAYEVPLGYCQGGNEVCIGKPCDVIAGELGAVSVSVLADGIPYAGWLRALDTFTELEYGSGELVSGRAEVLIPDFNQVLREAQGFQVPSFVLLLDDDNNGRCTSGEVQLPFEPIFDALELTLVFRVDGTAESRPCVVRAERAAVSPAVDVVDAGAVGVGATDAGGE